MSKQIFKLKYNKKKNIKIYVKTKYTNEFLNKKYKYRFGICSSEKKNKIKILNYKEY